MMSFSFLGLLIALMCISQIHGAKVPLAEGVGVVKCSWNCAGDAPSTNILGYDAVYDTVRNSVQVGCSYTYSQSICSQNYDTPFTGVRIPGTTLSTAAGIMIKIPADHYLKYDFYDKDDNIIVGAKQSGNARICNTAADACTPTEAITDATFYSQKDIGTEKGYFIWRNCYCDVNIYGGACSQTYDPKIDNTLYYWLQLWDGGGLTWKPGDKLVASVEKIYKFPLFCADSAGSAVCNTVPHCPLSRPCDKGYYGDVGNPPSPCTKCKTGYTTPGQTGAEESTAAACSECASGYFGSTTDGTSGCNLIVACDKGTYGPQGKSPCTKCKTGYTTPGETGADGSTAAACSECELGYVGSTTDGTSGCNFEFKACEKGTYGPQGKPPCTKCKTGYTTPGETGAVGSAAAVCSECASGYFGSTTDGTSGCDVIQSGCTVSGVTMTCTDGSCVTTYEGGITTKVCQKQTTTVSTTDNNSGGVGGGAIAGIIIALLITLGAGYYYFVVVPKAKASVDAAAAAAPPAFPSGTPAFPSAGPAANVANPMLPI